jgi:toxin ParE1/3/4
MKYTYHPDALVEYADAALYYEERVPGLGAQFTAEVEAAIAAVLAAPDRWRPIEEDVRRYLVHRFPYGLLYTIEPDQVFVVALMHLSREPGYWRHRVRS